MFNSVSEAIEDLQKQGYCMVEVKRNGSVKIGEKAFKSYTDFNILDSYSFGAGSDPDEEVSLYTISAPMAAKGYLAIGFGEHVDSEHAAIINHLLRRKSIESNLNVSK